MSRDTTMLHPQLQNWIGLLQEKCAAQGLRLGISECYRTVAEQDALYAKGRTAPGSIVTNAKGSNYSSQHQWYVACDFFQNVPGNLYPADFMNQVGAMAKSVGLGWGGDWKTVDKPHLYLKDWGADPTLLKKEYGTPEKFRQSWSVQMDRPIELPIVVDKVTPVKLIPVKPVLKKGLKGMSTASVKELQTLLNKNGAKLKVDGSFGSLTEEAVRSFQKIKGLVIDGCVGPITWGRLYG